MTYASVLAQLDAPVAAAIYVGDGGNDELAGARAAGFGLVVLADQAARRRAPQDLPELHAQADASVASLPDLLTLVSPAAP